MCFNLALIVAQRAPSFTQQLLTLPSNEHRVSTIGFNQDIKAEF
jgi:hypothetical protein